MKITLTLDNKTYEGDVVEVGVTIPVPPPIPPIPPPIPPIPPSPPPPPSPSGLLGSEGNPVILIKPITTVFSYGFDINTPAVGQYPIRLGETVWFKADPQMIEKFVITPPRMFKLTMIDYEPYADHIRAVGYSVNRSTLVKTELSNTLVGQTGWSDPAYNKNVYYLISLTELGIKSTAITIRWKGN